MKQLRATKWKNGDVIGILQRNGFVITRRTKHIFLQRPRKPGFVKVSMSYHKYMSLNAYTEMRHTCGLSDVELSRLFRK